MTNQTRHDVLNSITGPECICCMKSRLRTNYYFAECQHDQICKNCGEKQMLQSLNNNMIPTCFWACGAKLNTGNTSLFQYFGQSNKQRWYKKSKEMKKSEVNKKLKKPCRKVNCKGLIKNNRCPVCSTTYCLNCGDFDHDPTVKCKEQRAEVVFKGVKNCPKCCIPVVKDGGCLKIVCICKHQFCFQCLQDWNNSHHTKHGVSGCCAGFSGFFFEHLCCCFIPKSRKYQQNNPEDIPVQNKKNKKQQKSPISQKIKSIQEKNVEKNEKVKNQSFVHSGKSEDQIRGTSRVVVNEKSQKQ